MTTREFAKPMPDNNFKRANEATDDAMQPSRSARHTKGDSAVKQNESQISTNPPTRPARRRTPRATLTVSLPVEGDSQLTRVATVTVRRFADELVRSGLLAKEPLKGAYRWQHGKGAQPDRLIGTLTLQDSRRLLALLTDDSVEQQQINSK